MNQETTKYAPMPDFLALCDEFGITDVGLWRDQTLAYGIEETRAKVEAYGLNVVGYYRTAPMTQPDATERQTAIAENKRILDEAAQLGSKMVAFVVGGLAHSKNLTSAREQLKDSLLELAEYAGQVGVKVGLEPLNPIFAADRSIVSTLRQAGDYAQLDPQHIGVIVDTYHTWWDPQLQTSIQQLAAEGSLLTYQICDWTLPLPANHLLGRGYVNSGFIDFPTITRWVLDTGYNEEIEVEIFNQEVWDTEPRQVFERVVNDFEALVAQVQAG